MTIAERVAEIEATIAAILAGKSGWPPGLWDPAIKRLEALARATMMTDEELAGLSEHYQDARGMLGPTGVALLIETARRSTLTAHQRIAEAAERNPRRSLGAMKGRTSTDDSFSNPLPDDEMGE